MKQLPLIDQHLTRLTEPLFAGLDNPVFATPLDDWRSPCEIRTDETFSYWRPIVQTPRMSFGHFEAAIDVAIHPDLKAFYGSFWSGSLPCSFQQQPLALIQIWNPEDFDRLISNLIGHFLSQQRAASDRLTWFIGTFEDDSEAMVSLDNTTGEIVQELPGQGFQQRLAPALSDFLRLISLDRAKLNPGEL